MKELVAGTNCTVIGWGKKEDKNCEFFDRNIFTFSFETFDALEKTIKFLPHSKLETSLLSPLTLTGIQFPFELLDFDKNFSFLNIL
jgi:hypothetical protein